MLLNLKPIKTGANCYSNNWVLQICNYFGISYQPFFLRYFNDYLRIVNKNHSILDSDPSTTMGKKYPIEKLIGIKFKQVDVQGDYWSYVIYEINNKIPVPIRIESSKLPWWQYRSQTERLILIIGYDELNHKYVCADGYVTFEIQYLSKESIVSDAKIYKVDYDPMFLLNRQNAIDAILYGWDMQYINRKNDAMVEYNEYIQNNFLAHTERVSYKDLMIKPFIYNLSHFVFNREYFFRGVEYINQKSPMHKLANLLPLLEKLHQEWKVYKSLLIKSAINRNLRDLFLAGSLFNNLIKLEAIIAEKFLSIDI